MSVRSPLLWVDDFFEQICSGLSDPLREEIRRLPFTLGLASDPTIPWSQVFAHEVTLAAPCLFAEAMPRVSRDSLRHALFAHAVAVVQAMGIDRIEDGQAPRAPALVAALEELRSIRDEQLNLAAGEPVILRQAEAAENELREALIEEREHLQRAQSEPRASKAANASPTREEVESARIDFHSYEKLSEKKQGLGLVATVALATRAGWSRIQCEAAYSALLDIAVGLQLYDDVVDWEVDARSQRSWALALARCARPCRAGADPLARRAEVHGAAILERMLRRARSRFRAASRRAGVLGAKRLASWAKERVGSLDRLVERERRSAGYVHRAHALAPWAHAIFADNQ